jgi:hypothetical protein
MIDIDMVEYIENVLPPPPAGDLNDVPEMGKRMAHTEHFIIDNVMKAEPGTPGSYQRMVQCYQASADFADVIAEHKRWLP